MPPSPLASGPTEPPTSPCCPAAVVLLDRCAAAGYQPRMPALLAAACVALAAQQEGIPLETAALAGQLDRQVSDGGHKKNSWGAACTVAGWEPRHAGWRARF